MYHSWMKISDGKLVKIEEVQGGDGVQSRTGTDGTECADRVVSSMSDERRHCNTSDPIAARIRNLGKVSELYSCVSSVREARLTIAYWGKVDGEIRLNLMSLAVEIEIFDVDVNLAEISP